MTLIVWEENERKNKNIKFNGWSFVKKRILTNMLDIIDSVWCLLIILKPILTLE